jgi:hypothetical protein
MSGGMIGVNTLMCHLEQCAYYRSAANASPFAGWHQIASTDARLNELFEKHVRRGSFCSKQMEIYLEDFSAVNLHLAYILSHHGYHETGLLDSGNFSLYPFTIISA